MPKRNSEAAWWIASALVLVSFLAFTVWILDFAFTRSNAFPPYSSLRSDPQGAKALYDALDGMPGVRVERNRQRRIPARAGAAYLFLGVSPAALRTVPRTQLTEWERMAREGGRVVIAMTPVHPMSVGSTTGPFSAALPPIHEIEQRWGIRTRWKVDRETRVFAATPKQSSFGFQRPADGSAWRCRRENADGSCEWIEREFGRGSHVLLSQSFALSNEGLLEPNGKLIAGLIGTATTIVFDESHLGVVETGSVGALIRRYRLTGVALVLAILGLLFVWRQSGHFLPERNIEREAAMANLNSAAGMVSLLHRHIAARQIVATCVAEWKRSLSVLPYAQRRRAAMVEASAASSAGDPLAQYQTIVRSLHER